jgi:hypothetical protein
MRKRNIILFSGFYLFVILAAGAIATWSFSKERTTVFGKLSPRDLGEIRQAVSKDLRRYELPTFSKANLRNPKYVFGSVRQYAARRILWVDVLDEHTVKVFVGDSKERIASDGWSYTMRKEPSWQILGTSYWGAAHLAPADFKIPPGLR